MKIPKTISFGPIVDYLEKAQELAIHMEGHGDYPECDHFKFLSTCINLYYLTHPLEVTY